MTKDFRQTVRERMQRDAGFRRAMLAGAIETIAAGELEVSKSMLRQCVNASLGFDALSAAIGKSPKSVMRMLGPNGNPTSENLSSILACLQEQEGISLSVRAHRR